MESIEKVMACSKQFERDIIILKILLKCYHNYEEEQKLQYIEKVYRNMLDEIVFYKKVENQVLVNEIENDYDTVSSLLREQQEDIYAKFHLPCMMVIDNLRGEELKQFYSDVSSLLQNYPNINVATHQLYQTSSNTWSHYIDDLCHYIDRYASSQIKKLLPLTYLKNNTCITSLDYKTVMQLYKSIRLTVKYVADANPDEFQDLKNRFREIQLLYFILIAGEDLK
jgi:hypothetical protein